MTQGEVLYFPFANPTPLELAGELTRLEGLVVGGLTDVPVRWS